MIRRLIIGALTAGLLTLYVSRVFGIVVNKWDDGIKNRITVYIDYI